MKIVGVMTGNSLDAVDVVLTEFGNGKIVDIASLSVPYPKSLSDNFRKLRADFKQDDFCREVVADYTMLVAKAVNELLRPFDKKEIKAIGFSGQTLDHFPPSIAKGKRPYTLQVGDAALLSKLTNLPVAYDFRSDDIFNGGEGAPLAPEHNLHIAQSLRIPVIFCNAGNTGNISVTSKDKVVGWDVGPFNHFSDYLVRMFKNESCDKDGKYGSQGKIIPKFLEDFFDANDFYLLPPPKSSDPNWYKIPSHEKYDFYDVLRTTEYLATYAMVYNLKYVPEAMQLPSDFLVFGGGWKNPICLQDFRNILTGKGFILDKHKETFAKILARFKKTPEVSFSDKYGFSGDYMEARIFADMTYCLINNKPFTFPETTGCKTPTVCGILAYPNDDEQHKIVSRAYENK